MSAKEIAKFEHILSLFGVGSAFQQLCSHHSIITHRKMRGKMKDMHDLEYLDPTSNTLKKLSEEELDEVQAFLPFMNAMQNETGPLMLYPIDITKYSREDFIRYQEDSYDSDNPSQYNYAMSLIAEKHNKEMEKLAATTANLMTTNGGTTGTIGINHSTDNIGESLPHVPTSCGSSLIVNTGPNSKGGANVVEENRDDVTPASNNGINCNNGLGIGTNGRGFDVDDDGILPHEPTSNPGDQFATTKTYPTDATPGSTNGNNCSNENNGESLSHASPDGQSPIVTISPNTKGADINGENGISPNTKGADINGENKEITDSGMMRNYGECTHLNNNNDNNEYEHAEHTQYRRIKTEDISTWARSSAQLYSGSNDNSHNERTRNEWEAIALCAHLTDRVSKYVKNAISSYAVKDWQWLARLVERLTHRGLLWYGVIAVVIMGLVMHDAHVDIKNDVVRSICSFSLNNPIDSSNMQGLIPSSWGRSSATCSTHSEYHSPEMKLSSSPYQSDPKFGDLTKVEAVVPRFDDASKTFEDEPRLWEDEDYANHLITWNVVFGTSLPSHAGARLQTKLTENALRHTNTSKRHTNTSKTHSDMCRMDEQTISSGLLTLVPNYYDDLTSQDVRFNLNLQVGNPPNTYQLTKYIQTRSSVQINTEANYGYNSITSMVTRNQLRDRGVSRNITQYHDRSGMSDQKDKPATRLQVHPRVTPVSDVKDIVSHFGANPNLSIDMPNDGECLNIPQDRMTHDIRRDSIRYDSMQQIFEESGENIIWAWPIVNTTTARMKGAQDYRSSRRDRTYNTMTTDDGELTNSYPENNPDGDVANIDEYLRRRGHILNRLLGIIGLTSARDTLVDTDIVSDPEPDESEILDEEGIRIYQSLIGAKWLVQLDRFDIAVLIMTLSSYWHSLVVATLIGELIEQ